MKRALVLLAILCSPEPRAEGIDAKELEKLVDGVMAAEMKRQQIPGAAFVLVQNGRVVLAKGFGAADVEKKTRVRADWTIFPIGSVTKVFTATAVVQLADRGKLDLDADVNPYLRRVRVPATYDAPVTARHLLTHTGGFDELRGRLLQSTRERVEPLSEFLESRLVRIRPPGAMTAYSSFGMTLAGLVVEDVTGMSYERYLKRNVWDPLGMSRTSVEVPSRAAGVWPPPTSSMAGG